jgi:hypothetical protein
MTDPRDPDDLASALLDGLLSDDEAAVARRDPAVAARLAELAAVRDAVRQPPRGPDPAARERGLAAALAAYDSPDEADEPSGGVSSMGGGRPTRPAAPRPDTPWRPQGTAHRRWLTAAAIVLVVVGVGILARNWDTGDADETSTARDESSSEGDESNAAAEAGGGTDQSAPPGDGTQLAIVDLGAVDSPAALAERARVILAGRSSEAPSAAPGGEAESGQGQSAADARPAACADDAQAERIASGTEGVVLRGRASLDGQPVDVWVVGAGGDERVVAVDASCAVVVDQSLPD